MDWNDDGLLDIIVGDRNGYIHYYRRTSNLDAITLTKEADIRCAGTTIDAGYNSAPVCVDWNEDGDLDMLVGNQTGNVRLYLNEGSDGVPVFSTFTNLQSGGSNILHYRNCPQVIDLNLDGKKDLLCGANDYKIYYYENTGTNSSPSFSGSEILVSEYAGIRFSVADWNGDSFLDILSSDYNGYVEVHIQVVTGTAESPETIPSRTLLLAQNPFYGSVLIQGDGFNDAVIEVFDLSGRIVADGSFSGSYLLDGSSLATGTYFATVRDSEGTATLRLLKL